MASNESSARRNSSNSAEGSNSNVNLETASLQDKLELLLLQQQLHQNSNLFLEREMNLNINRSGSAPPTVEGALRAASNLFINPNLAQSDSISTNCNNNDSIQHVNNLMTEEEIRSTPEYLEYYYSHENLNPRLPPPLLSKEDWRVAQRVKAAPGFGLGDWRNSNNKINSSDADDVGNSSSLFLMQPVKKGEDDMLELRKAALRNISHKNSSELLDKLCNDSSGMGLRRKSFADILQEGSGRPASHLSRPPSQNSVNEYLSDQNVAEMQNKGGENAVAGLSNPQNLGSTSSSFSNSASEMLQKSSSGLISGFHLSEKLNSGSSSSSIFEFADAAAESFSGLNMSRGGQLSNEDILRSSILMRMSSGLNPNQQHYIENLINRGLIRGLNNPNPLINEATSLPRRAASTTNLQAQHSPPGLLSLEAMRNLLGDGHNLRNNNQAAVYFPFAGQLQYLRGRNMGNITGNTSQGGYVNNDPRSCSDLQALENAYLEALLLQQKQQYLTRYLSEVSSANHQLHGNAAFSPYDASSMMNALNSGVSSRRPMFQNERGCAQSTRNLKNIKGESSVMLRSQSGSILKNGKLEALIEGAKNSKNKALDLNDVLGHVFEFSTDQFGSRFIQQKLENATDEEKTKILVEIIPHTRELMIDVFGNYVIQKFFEHGSDYQRRELATHLIGHVLSLSLHMYGCRVIQKALEVVDVELKTKIVTELDGSVIKCVRDQNGNHVIQKCIEHVPQDRIQFMIKPFLGQVATLSTHPYGCRVIQRVIEHCDDPKTQQTIMDEILAAVCNLAEDQYGNYVLQHVLQHGKPQERSAIISRLAGHIVEMSQQKFASNVIEKCLTYGKPEERKLLVTEMLDSTDDNEPLQAMMKDQFGNYVVQKVMETCDEESCELILSRVKDHLSTLKKYTYGKHIVSRVEKLLTAGEKHAEKTSPKNSS